MKRIVTIMSVVAVGLAVGQSASAQQAPIPPWGPGPTWPSQSSWPTQMDDEDEMAPAPKKSDAPKAPAPKVKSKAKKREALPGIGKEKGKDRDWASKSDKENGNGDGNGDEDENGGCDDGCDDCGEDGCEEEEEEEKCPCYLFGPGEAMSLWDEMFACGDKKPAVHIGGWLQGGYHTDPTPLSQQRGDGLAFNDVPNDFNLHQGWLYAEKALDTKKCGWDWGFRADLVYGTDAQKTQSFGGLGWDNDWDHGVYGWALPQAYVELGTGDFSVKAGHFFTPAGYEVVAAPGNFFYSHALTHFNSEPFTHTGVLATYKLCEDIEVYSGWALGWDTGFDAFGDSNILLGGFKLTLTDDITFTYISTSGDFGLRGEDAQSHHFVMDVTLTDKLNWVIQSDILRIENAPGGAFLGDDDVGLTNYLYYAYNDCIKFGARAEWWKNDGVDNYAVTYGVNIRPHANLVIRPEVRHAWVPTTDFHEDIFGIDAIFTF